MTIELVLHHGLLKNWPQQASRPWWLICGLGIQTGPQGHSSPSLTVYFPKMAGTTYSILHVLFTLWYCHPSQSSNREYVASPESRWLWVPQSDSMPVSRFKPSETGSLHVLPLGMLIFRIQPPCCEETQFTWWGHMWLFWLSELRF